MNRDIEKIKKYIAATKFSEKVISRYDMGCLELKAMILMLDTGEAISLAFEYGRAKGFRSAKAKVQG